MNYVTIKNGVVEPIQERKQLYYKKTRNVLKFNIDSTIREHQIINTANIDFSKPVDITVNVNIKGITTFGTTELTIGDNEPITILLDSRGRIATLASPHYGHFENTFGGTNTKGHYSEVCSCEGNKNVSITSSDIIVSLNDNNIITINNSFTTTNFNIKNNTIEIIIIQRI